MRFSTHRPGKSVLIQLCAVLIFVIRVASGIEAQEVAVNTLPDAPVPEFHAVHAVMQSHPAVPSANRHRWLTLNHVSIAVLLGGEALDSWSTYRNLTHRKWICGYSPALGDAVTYISNDGQHYDAETIRNVLCGPGPSGQAANYAYDVTRTGAFTETGWVTKFGLADKRDFVRVEAWNLADDVGQFLVARYLGKRKSRLRRIGVGVNFSRGLVHMECGVLNIQFARKNNNPGAWDFHLPDQSNLYPAPRWWGRQ